MSQGAYEIRIHRSGVLGYFVAIWLLNTVGIAFVLLLLGTMLEASVFFIGAVAIGLAMMLGALFLPRLQTDAMEYRCEKGALHIRKGVVFLSRKSIPLDRITDLELVQGPLMRMFGIWGLRVQTAGTAQPAPEAIIWGPQDPEIVRHGILKLRDAP